MMKKLSLQLSLIICCLGIGTPLFGTDINHIHPIPGEGRILTTDFGYVGPHLEFSAQLFSHYMYQPLKEFSLSDGTLSDRVDHRFDMEFSISLALWRHLQIAFSLPVTLYQSGYYSAPDPNSNSVKFFPGAPYSAGGLGDLHLFLKTIFWENSTHAKPAQVSGGIGLTADIAVPVVTNGNYYAQGDIRGNLIPTTEGLRKAPEATAQFKLVSHLQYQGLQIGLNLGFILSGSDSG